MCKNVNTASKSWLKLLLDPEFVFECWADTLRTTVYLYDMTFFTLLNVTSVSSQMSSHGNWKTRGTKKFQNKNLLRKNFCTVCIDAFWRKTWAEERNEEISWWTLTSLRRNFSCCICGQTLQNCHSLFYCFTFKDDFVKMKVSWRVWGDDFVF